MAFKHGTYPGNVPKKEKRRHKTILTLKGDRTYNFHFFQDECTVELLMESHVMFIMRGLSGSGKSTIVQWIKKLYHDVVVCSADDFFMQDGEYQFSKEGLKDAHQQCRTRAADACHKKHNVIVIDNTNVKRWEMKPYSEMASLHGYLVITVIPKTPWAFDAQRLAAMNKHGVGEDVLVDKVRMFEDIIPLYYGWFLNQNWSQFVIDQGKDYYIQSLKTVPRFKTYLVKHFEKLGCTLDYDNIYTRSDSSSSNLHCTSFFTEHGRNCGSKNYYTKADSHMGKADTLYIIGFVITPRSIGARVALTTEQLYLWNKDDDEIPKMKLPSSGGQASGSSSLNWKSPEKASSGGQASGSSSLNWRSREKPSSGGQARYKKLDCNPSPLDVNLLGDILKNNLKLEGSRNRFQPTHGVGSRAHITISYSQGTSAVQTGFDLMEVIQLERLAAEGNKCETYQIKEATIKYYGNGICVTYLNKPHIVPVMFGGRY